MELDDDDKTMAKAWAKGTNESSDEPTYCKPMVSMDGLAIG
jgi:hypothetical protein